jgi:hypothetical protein
MRRIILGTLAMLSILAATAVGPAAGAPIGVTAPDNCTHGDAEAIAQAGLQFAGRALGGQPHGEPAAATSKWSECQFRLYDDNDEDNPEVAHVFSEDDWIVGAVAYFITDSELILVGGTPRSATAYIDTWTTHLYFGPSSLPDASLPEVSLATTGYKSTQLPGLGEKYVWRQVYAIWPAGSLAPGTYRYRLEQLIPDGPLAGTFEARGAIIITDAP